MQTTVRLTASAKARLKRLQQLWHRARGQTPSQQEILGSALAYVERHPEQFLAEEAWQPLSGDRLAALHALQGDYGAADASKVDDVVYGDET